MQSSSPSSGTTSTSENNPSKTIAEIREKAQTLDNPFLDILRSFAQIGECDEKYLFDFELKKEILDDIIKEFNEQPKTKVRSGRQNFTQVKTKELNMTTHLRVFYLLIIKHIDPELKIYLEKSRKKSVNTDRVYVDKILKGNAWIFSQEAIKNGLKKEEGDSIEKPTIYKTMDKLLIELISCHCNTKVSQRSTKKNKPHTHNYVTRLVEMEITLFGQKYKFTQELMEKIGDYYTKLIKEKLVD